MASDEEVKEILDGMIKDIRRKEEDKLKREADKVREGILEEMGEINQRIKSGNTNYEDVLRCLALQRELDFLRELEK